MIQNIKPKTGLYDRELDKMSKSKIELLLLVLIGIVIILMVTNLGLFIQINQLQQEVLQTLQSFQQSSQRLESLSVGAKAPSFNLQDTEGRSISLDDFAEESVMLVFSSTNCSACQSIYPSLKKFNENHPELAILLISKSSDDENKKLVQQQDFPFPVVTMQDEVAEAYQVSTIPFFYLINKDRVITKGGFISSLEQLENLADIDT